MTFSFGYSAPQITEEEERRDYAMLSEQERRRISGDVMGDPTLSIPTNFATTIPGSSERGGQEQQMSSPSPATTAPGGDEDDDDEYIDEEVLLQHMTRLLLEQQTTAASDGDEHAESSSSAAYHEAMEHAPHLIETESNPLDYLRNEDYEVESAVVKLHQYWQLRKRVFGEELFLLPLTLEGAMRRDWDLLKLGMVQLLPPDRHGRIILYYERARWDREIFTRNGLVRVFFYMLTAGMQQQRQERQQREEGPPRDDAHGHGVAAATASKNGLSPSSSLSPRSGDELFKDWDHHSYKDEGVDDAGAATAGRRRRLIRRGSTGKLHAAPATSPNDDYYSFIFLTNMRNYSLEYFDRKLVAMISPLTTRGVMPLRTKASHICYAATNSVVKLILPIFKTFLSNGVRRRTVVHLGWSDKTVVDDLKKYGIGDDEADLPEGMGGRRSPDDHLAWLRRRQRIEADAEADAAAAKDASGSETVTDSAASFDPEESTLGGSAETTTTCSLKVGGAETLSPTQMPAAEQPATPFMPKVTTDLMGRVQGTDRHNDGGTVAETSVMTSRNERKRRSDSDVDVFTPNGQEYDGIHDEADADEDQLNPLVALFGPRSLPSSSSVVVIPSKRVRRFRESKGGTAKEPRTPSQATPPPTACGSVIQNENAVVALPA